ncbi:MAG: hypothetical protein MI924_29815 [Chloroflexales bacterium]|nr:hypothetical protein [Chloroflexales bacterium]
MSESQVSRWKNQDPAFVAELNWRRRDLWQAPRDKLAQLYDAALEMLLAALGPDDPIVRDARIRLLCGWLRHWLARCRPKARPTRVMWRLNGMRKNLSGCCNR